MPWVKDLKAGHAGLEKSMVTDPNHAEEMMRMERLIMVTVVDPASVVRHHLDDDQLMRFQLEVGTLLPFSHFLFPFPQLDEGS